jgi:hypothetical protein
MCLFATTLRRLEEKPALDDTLALIKTADRNDWSAPLRVVWDKIKKAKEADADQSRASENEHTRFPSSMRMLMSSLMAPKLDPSVLTPSTLMTATLRGDDGKLTTHQLFPFGKISAADEDAQE